MANELEIFGEVGKMLAAAVAADEDQRGGAAALLVGSNKVELNKRWGCTAVPLKNGDWLVAGKGRGEPVTVKDGKAHGKRRAPRRATGAGAQGGVRDQRF